MLLSSISPADPYRIDLYDSEELDACESPLAIEGISVSTDPTATDNDNDNAGDADINGDGSAALEDKFMAYDGSDSETASEQLITQRSSGMEILLELDKAIVSKCFLHDAGLMF